MNEEISLPELMAATGIKSLKEYEAAERQLRGRGLIRVGLGDGVRTIVLLDPATGEPLKPSKGVR